MAFYADDGRIAEQDHIWVQDGLTVMVEMFRRVGLRLTSKIPRPWSILPASSRESGVRRNTSAGQQGKE